MKGSTLFFILKKLLFAEHILAYSAKGADKVIGKIFEFCAGSNTAFGQALFLVIFPATSITYVYFHFYSPCFINLNYFFKIRSSVLAKGTNEVVGKFVLIVNISAHGTYVAFLSRSFGLWLYVVLIVGVGHSFFVGNNS